MGNSTWFTIGKVTGVHGLKGFLKVWSFAQSIDTFGPKRIVLLKSENGLEKEFTIIKAQPHKKGILLLLEGVNNRNLADDLVDSEILIDRDLLPEPEEDSWYWQDLIGLDVKDEFKGFIGKVKHIFPTGANDVLVVKNKKKEVLVPMHRNFVISVDLEQSILITRLPEELLEDS